jgi:hypothetical protein
MNEKLADVMREIPITMRPEPAKNYSLNYRDEALRPKGMITAAEFEAAAAVGTVEQYERLSAEIKEARSEFEQFEQVAYSQAGPDALSFEVLSRRCRNANSPLTVFCAKSWA